jgi:hypothetical protein
LGWRPRNNVASSPLNGPTAYSIPWPREIAPQSHDKNRSAYGLGSSDD